MTRTVTLDDFIADWDASRRIFDALTAAMDDLGRSNLRVTRSQVAFRGRKAFAWVWILGRYLRGDHPPLVLTLALGRRDPSKRWKQIVEPVNSRYSHHLELRSAHKFDREVCAWLHEARSQAE